MSSSEMSAEGDEDNKMEVSCSGEEKDHKAGSQLEGPKLKTALQVNPEKTSEATEDNKMEVSSSADGNKDKAESQTKVSNLGAMENTPPDNSSAMDTSELKNKTTRQNPKSGKETQGLKAEGTKKSLMKCPICQAEIAPSVTFCKQKNDQCEFSIGLHQDNGDDHTALFANKIGFTEPAGNLQKNECVHCKQSIIYKSVATRNNKMGGFDIELSINISKEDHLQGEAMENSVSKGNLGGTKSQNRNSDDKRKKQDNRDGSSSETSTGCKTDNSSKRRIGSTDSSKFTESKKFSSKEPEQSNQTTDREGWSFSNFFKPSTPVVKVHYTPNSDMFGADAEVMKQLKENLKSSVQLEKSRENCDIIIVFCPVSRSYESEVKSVMEKERVSSSGKPFILVLMHHTREMDYSTAGCDTSEVLKNVSYVHVFYHETVKGLLNCKQNYMAIKTIENKLKTHKP